MKRTTIFVPHQLFARLKALSKITGISVSELIRRAVDEYLGRQK